MGYGRRRFRRRSRGRRRGRRGRMGGRSSKKRMSMRRARFSGGKTYTFYPKASVAQLGTLVTDGGGVTDDGSVYTFAPGFNGTTFFAASLAFDIASIPQYLEYTTLFDQYYIAKVCVTMRIMPSNTGGAMLVHHVNDWDDNATFLPTQGGVNAMKEYRGYTCKSSAHSDHSTLSWTIVPKFAQQVYQSTLVTAYRPASGWLDCVYSPPHYGMKWILQAEMPSTSSVLRFGWDVKYVLKFRNTR